MNILEVLQRSTEFLAKRGVASPRLQVELLLAHLLKMPRMNLYLNFERTLTDAETQTLREAVRRRGQREPLQYITGSVSFCGLELSVAPAVLIPRPETEMLAERAWKFLGQSPARFLDLGTGSGCLAITLLTHAPQAEADAIDVSSGALEIARQNAERHQLLPRLQFHHGDGFAALPAGRRFDLIVSNPPYIPTADIATLEPEVREHEPIGALDGGADGMDFYRRIAREAKPYLQRDGRLMLELNDHGAEGVHEILTGESWTVEVVEADYNRYPRILVAHLPGQSHDDRA